MPVEQPPVEQPATEQPAAEQPAAEQQPAAPSAEEVAASAARIQKIVSLYRVADAMLAYRAGAKRADTASKMMLTVSEALAQSVATSTQASWVYACMESFIDRRVKPHIGPIAVSITGKAACMASDAGAFAAEQFQKAILASFGAEAKAARDALRAAANFVRVLANFEAWAAETCRCGGNSCWRADSHRPFMEHDVARIAPCTADRWYTYDINAAGDSLIEESHLL